MPVSRSRVLMIIVLSQFACVSLWFAGNSILDDLMREYKLPFKIAGHLASMVQLGFISGTLAFAFFSVADRFSPSKVFWWSAVAASMSNILFIFSKGNILWLYSSRFITGFFLAGIYPVGMKIAADYFAKDLEKALGYLVGALVFGTSLPFLLNDMQSGLPWNYVIVTTSVLAIAGGLMVYLFVPDGPHRVKGAPFNPGVVVYMFSDRFFRQNAFGYFGHMWELYAFWTFVPLALLHFHPGQSAPMRSSHFSLS